MKKIIFILFFIVSIIAILHGCKPKEEKVIIGVNVPLTGRLSFYGNEVKDALTLVKRHHPDSGIEFVFEDNQSLASNSVTVFNKFATNRNIPLIVSCNSPLSLPLRPLAERNQRVLLALVTGARDFGVLNEWSFRDAINQDQEGEMLAEYMVEKTDYRRGVTFVVNDDYGLGGASAFKERFTELGGRILLEETFEMDERDLRPKIIKLLNTRPEFVFLVGREQTIISSIRQIRERDRNIPIITSDAFESPTVLDGLGDSAKGIVFASYYNNFENEKGQRYLREFREYFARDPGIYATDAYVAGNYLLYLIDKSGNNSRELRDLLIRMEYESPIKGKLYVNEKRDVISPVAVYKIDDNFNKVPLFGF